MGTAPARMSARASHKVPFDGFARRRRRAWGTNRPLRAGGWRIEKAPSVPGLHGGATLTLTRHAAHKRDGSTLTLERLVSSKAIKILDFFPCHLCRR